MLSIIIAVVALVVAAVAVALSIRDRRRNAAQAEQLNADIVAVHTNLAHHLNTSARWHG